MKLDTFLSLFDQKEKKKQGAEFLATHVKKDVYIPIEKKKELAISIIELSMKEYADSILKYILTCITFFDVYTDITRSSVDNDHHEKLLSDFNKINERRIFDMLIGLVDDREFKEFNMVLQMVTDDFIVNK